MGTAERRERERLRLREKILDAARELFVASGYEAVTMRKIAEKIEYSPTTIYLHFADKDALVRELCSRDFLTLASRFQQLEAETDPIRRLKGIGAAFLRLARELPNQYRLMFMTPTPPVAVDERRIEKGKPEEDAWAFVKDAIAAAQRAGVLRRDLGSETIAQLFFAGLHGIAALYIAKSNDPWIDWRPVEELSELMVDALLRGCAPAERSREAEAGARTSGPGRDKGHEEEAGPRRPGGHARRTGGYGVFGRPDSQEPATPVPSECRAEGRGLLHGRVRIQDDGRPLSPERRRLLERLQDPAAYRP